LGIIPRRSEISGSSTPAGRSGIGPPLSGGIEDAELTRIKIAVMIEYKYRKQEFILITLVGKLID